MARQERGLRYNLEAKEKGFDAFDRAKKVISELNEQSQIQARRARSLAKANVKLDESYKNLPKSLDSVKKGLTEQSRLLASQANSFQTSAKFQKQVIASNKKMARSYDDVVGRQRKAKRANEQLNKSQSKVNASLGASERALGRTGSKFGGVAQGLIAGARAAGPYGIAVAAAAEASRVLFAVVDLGVASIKAQANALVNAVKITAEFEQETRRVTALAGDAPGVFDKLRDAALASGEATLFTGRQAAEGLREIVKAGFTANQAVAALPGTLQLAGAGMISLSKAADISTNILTGYNLQVDQLGRVNDVLLQATTKANTNIVELGTGFSYVAGIASSTNQRLEGTTAILGVLANAGIKGSKSGRAVANALQRIIKPTAEGRAVFEKYNITLTNYAGKTRQLTSVLKDLEKNGASSAEVLSIFGSVAGRSLVTVLNQGTGAIDKLSNSLDNAKGRAAEFEAQVQNTLSAQVKILESSFERLNIEVGTRFQDTFKGATKVLIDNVKPLSRNTELLNRFNAVGRDVVLVAANILDAVAAVTPAFGALGGAALEVGTALNVSNGGLVAFAKTFVEMVPFVGPTIKLFGVLFEIFEGGVKVIEYGARTFQLLGKKIDEVTEPIQKRLKPALESISPLLKEIISPTVTLSSELDRLGDELDKNLPASTGFFASFRAGAAAGDAASDSLSKTARELRGYADTAGDARKKQEQLSASLLAAKSAADAYFGTISTLTKAGKNAAGRFGELFNLLATQDTSKNATDFKEYAGAVKLLGASFDVAKVAARDFFLSKKSLKGIANEAKLSFENQLGIGEAARKQERKIQIQELNNALLVETNKKSRINLEFERDKLKVLNKSLGSERQYLELKNLEQDRVKKLGDLNKQQASAGKKRAQERERELKARQSAMDKLSKLIEKANKASKDALIEELQLQARLATAKGDEFGAIKAQFAAKRQQVAFNDNLEASAKRITLEALGLEEAEARRLLQLQKRQRLLAKEQSLLEAQSKAASLAGDPLRAIKLQADARRKALSAKTDIAPEVRKVELQNINKTEDQEAARTLLDQRVKLARAEADILGQSASIMDKRLAIEKRFVATLAEINASQESAAQKEAETTKAQIEKKRELLELDLARVDAITKAVQAGINTDVSSVVDQGLAERTTALQSELDQLKSRRETAKEGGADTTFLDRTIEVQQRAIEQEQKYQQGLAQTINLWTQGASRVVTLGSNVASLAEIVNVSGDAWIKNADAQKAAVAGIGAAASLGSTLASAFVDSAKERAKVEAAINAAAAVASFAVYAYSGFTAGNFLAASVQHGVAAAKYGIIAGSSAGGGGSGGRGSGGSTPSFGGGLPTVNLAEQQERLGRVIGESVKAALEQPVQNIYNIDFGRSTHLSNAPDIARTIRQTVDGDRTTSYQPKRAN